MSICLFFCVYVLICGLVFLLVYASVCLCVCWLIYLYVSVCFSATVLWTVCPCFLSLHFLCFLSAKNACLNAFSVNQGFGSCFVAKSRIGGSVPRTKGDFFFLKFRILAVLLDLGHQCKWNV